MAKYLLEKAIELELYTQAMIDQFVQDVQTWWNDLSQTIDSITDSISQAYWDFLDAVARALFADPLVIDMNGDGIQLDSFQSSNALFDLNGDSIKENTGWTQVGTDDSFLVIDKNNNGNIDDISEMFGNQAVAGFADLKSYDSNNDNLINASDSQFDLLRMWNDANANGTVDAGELTALGNITEISLNKYASLANINGNLQTAISTVKLADGTTRNIHELSFGFEAPSISTNPDLTLPSTFRLSIDSILLPYSRGYNTLYSWHPLPIRGRVRVGALLARKPNVISYLLHSAYWWRNVAANNDNNYTVLNITYGAKVA